MEYDICVSCKEKIDARIFSETGLIEYETSGLCEICSSKKEDSNEKTSI